MNVPLAGFQRNPKIEEAPLQNELMLFDPESAKFFVLNSTMAWVWKNCDGNAPAELVSAMVANFDGIDPSQASADIDEALNELRKLGLVNGP